MTENFDSIECGPEKIPSEQEVWDKFEEILDGRKYEERDKQVDENGLFEWLLWTNEAGSIRRVIILYTRGKILPPMGRRLENLVIPATINVDATHQYEYVNGDWVEKE